MPDPRPNAVTSLPWHGLPTLLAAVAVGLVGYVGFSGAQLFGLVTADAPAAVADPPALTTYRHDSASLKPKPAAATPTEQAETSRNTVRPPKPSSGPSASASPAVPPPSKGDAHAPVATKQSVQIQRAHWADRQLAAMLHTLPPSPMSLLAGGATWVLPTSGYHLTARFGETSYLWSSTHTGLDFATTTGTPVRAATAGTVTFSGWDGAYGNKIEITHPDGTETWYAHMSKLYASVGTQVGTGTVIGAVGATGNVTGPHLHFEVRPGGGDPIDPFTALQQHGLQP